MTVRVTEVAVVKRLQRVLAAEGKYLRTASSRKQKRWGLGRHYLIGAKGVVDKNVDIQKLARDLKLLKPGESLSDSGSLRSCLPLSISPPTRQCRLAVDLGNVEQLCSCQAAKPRAARVIRRNLWPNSRPFASYY